MDKVGGGGHILKSLGIVNSVLRALLGITRLCQVMPNSDPRDKNGLSYPQTHVGCFFLHTFGCQPFDKRVIPQYCPKIGVFKINFFFFLLK